MPDGGRRPSAAGLWLGRIIMLMCIVGLAYTLARK